MHEHEWLETVRLERKQLDDSEFSLDVLQPGIAAVSNAHNEKFFVFREIRVSYFSTGKELVKMCKTEGKAHMYCQSLELRC